MSWNSLSQPEATFGDPPGVKQPSAFQKGQLHFSWEETEAPPPSRTRVPIFVMDPQTGESVACPDWILVSDNVGRVKGVAGDLLRLPGAGIQLSWGGQLLEDQRTLNSYKIDYGQCLHAVRIAGQETLPLQVDILWVDDPWNRSVPIRLRVEAWSVDTVLQLKRQILEQTGVPMGEQRLTACGRALVDERRLSSYLQAPGNVISLQLSRPFKPRRLERFELERSAQTARCGRALERPGIPLTVRNAQGPATYVEDFSPFRTVWSLRQEVAKTMNVDPARQMLIHRGSILQDGCTGSHYNMRAGDSIDAPLVGGAQPVAAAKLQTASWSSKEPDAMPASERTSYRRRTIAGGTVKPRPAQLLPPAMVEDDSKARERMRKKGSKADVAADEGRRTRRTGSKQLAVLEVPQRGGGGGRAARQAKEITERKRLLDFPDELIIPLGSRTSGQTAPRPAPASTARRTLPPAASLAAERACLFVRGITESALAASEGLPMASSGVARLF